MQRCQTVTRGISSSSTTASDLEWVLDDRKFPVLARLRADPRSAHQIAREILISCENLAPIKPRYSFESLYRLLTESSIVVEEILRRGEISGFSEVLVHFATSKYFENLSFHPYGVRTLTTILSTADRRGMESILHLISLKISNLSRSPIGYRLVMHALSCVPSSKILLPCISSIAGDLAVHPVGYRVVVAAVERANSQALGFLEGVISRKFQVLVSSKFGCRVLLHVLRRSTTPGHSQADVYSTIILDKWGPPTVIAATNSEHAAEVLVGVLRSCRVESRKLILSRLWLSRPLKEVLQTGTAIALFGQTCGWLDDESFRVVASQFGS